MIKVIFIAPYKELGEEAECVFKKHTLSEKLEHTIPIIAADELEQLELDCDVVIARGYTAQRLKERDVTIPVIEVAITGFDIIKALVECLKLYHPTQIGFILKRSGLEGIEFMQALSGCPVKLYNPKGIHDIDRVLEQAVHEGCDAVIAGYSVHKRAIKMGLHCTTIKMGEESVTKALDEGVRAVEIMRTEREKAEIHQTIISGSSEGIIYVDKRLILGICNHEAEKYYSGSNENIIGLPLQEIFPMMTGHVKATIKSAKAIQNELLKVVQAMLSVSYNPVVVNKRVVGVVISFQNVTRIQQVEGQIRKKMSDRGLVAKYHFKDIIHESRVMKDTIEIANKYAKVTSNVLIIGETGTGKELLAQSIHNASSRCHQPFVAINCAALPENLLESELFGYVEGAFTGTSKGGKTGLFETAHNGTIFLDEVSEIPLSFQSKLLRVLQEREVRKIGDDKVITIDVRVIAATNRDLAQLVEEGRFRQDLLYRLDVLKLNVPPLRIREDDVIKLFTFYMKHFDQHFSDRKAANLPEDAKMVLRQYPFNGNVRELKNVAERVSVIYPGEEIHKLHLENALFMKEKPYAVQPGKALMKEEYPAEQLYMEQVLRECGYNQTKAARKLGINRSTLWRKMQKYSKK